jgi:NOL1/NOP2/sun family putative RNA methylase
LVSDILNLSLYEDNPITMLPKLFLDRMKQQLGDEFDPFLISYDEPSSLGLRVNTLKLNPEKFASLSPFPLAPLPWTTDGFTLPKDTRPGKHPYHAAGLYYLQDPSAMAVTELLDPQPGERILDLAAAPGGKSTHIAARMRNQGILVVNDIHPRRVRDLSNNLERWGARNVIILNETPSRLVDHFGAYFDRVLVDAPCSGEGMFRKDPASRREWTPKLVESCAIRQDAILSEAANLVRPGGRFVYATCTFAPQEDEGTILRFLESHPDFEITIPYWANGFSPGRPDWVSSPGFEFGSPNVDTLSHTVRLWPHKVPGEGHFIASLHKKSDTGSTSPSHASFSPPPLSKEARFHFEAFAAETLGWQPALAHLSMHGSHVYYQFEGGPDLRGLRVFHWGWWLGILKTNRFEPSHALAMALQPGDVQQVLSLTADDPQTMGYLHGEVLPSQGPDGWVMVAVDGYPLGWAKRVQNRLKSRSPKWLRWM